MKYLTLVVDDQPESVALLRSVLEARQFEVITASTKEQATQMIERFLPHILVVDIELGAGANGLDWLEQVRQGPLFEIPAVIMSSSNFLPDVQRGIGLDVNDYIIKPAEQGILIRKIEALIRRVEQKKLYEAHFSQDRPAQATIRVEGIVTGLGENGICVASEIVSAKPQDLSDCSSPLITEMGLRLPRLRLTTIENEPIAPKGLIFRSNIEASGWNDIERGILRAWIRRKGLKPINLKNDQT